MSAELPNLSEPEPPKASVASISSRTGLFRRLCRSVHGESDAETRAMQSLESHHENATAIASESRRAGGWAAGTARAGVRESVSWRERASARVERASEGGRATRGGESGGEPKATAADERPQPARQPLRSRWHSMALARSPSEVGGRSAIGARSHPQIQSERARAGAREDGRPEQAGGTRSA